MSNKYVENFLKENNIEISSLIKIANRSFYEEIWTESMVDLDVIEKIIKAAKMEKSA